MTVPGRGAKSKQGRQGKEEQAAAVTVASGGRRCKWRLEVRLARAHSGGGGSSQKKNAIVLSFKTRDASHEKRSQGAEAGREERSRQQQ